MQQTNAMDARTAGIGAMHPLWPSIEPCRVALALSHVPSDGARGGSPSVLVQALACGWARQAPARGPTPA